MKACLMRYLLLYSLRSNFNTREFNSREHYRFFGHNSEPCGNFRTILRQHLPIIPPDLPIPTRDLNSSVRPEFLNPKFVYKTEKSSRVLTAERNRRCLSLHPNPWSDIAKSIALKPKSGRRKATGPMVCVFSSALF